MLSEAQFGLRKNHSTATCIHTLLEYVYWSMDAGVYTGVVYLDLKKAFDMCICLIVFSVPWYMV